jgi:hypothetical protein
LVELVGGALCRNSIGFVKNLAGPPNRRPQCTVQPRPFQPTVSTWPASTTVGTLPVPLENVMSSSRQSLRVVASRSSHSRPCAPARLLTVGTARLDVHDAVGHGTVEASIRASGGSERPARPFADRGGGRGVVVWRFAGARAPSSAAERRAQRLTGASFWLLAAFVSIEAVRTLINGHHAATSWVGIGPTLRSGRLDERLRRNTRVSILDRPCDLVPVQPPIQPHPDPAAVADVGRAEVVLGLGAHQRLLHALGRGAPQRQAPVAVMVVEEHHECLAPAHEEGRLAVREALGHFGEPEAD